MSTDFLKPMQQLTHFCVLLVCTVAVFCQGQFVAAQQPADGATNAAANSPDAEPQSLQELRAAAAKRSRYLQLRPPNADAQQLAAKPNPKTFQQVILPILTKSCVPCHGPDTVEGNIRIDTLNPDLVHGDDVNWWVEVQAVLSNSEMPPPDSDPLPDKDRSTVVEWLAQEIQVASTVRRATGGHSSFRRLTRYEYNYAMQDLLGLPWDFAKDLPPEAHSEDGFQNSSEMLHMSVTQLQTYRQLALQALRRATVTGPQPPVIHWGVSMEQAAAKEWPKQAAAIDKVKEQFKDDPEKQQQEVDALLASFRKSHNRPYYRRLSTGETARAEWRYNGAKYAFAPLDKKAEFPESFDHVAVIPSGHNQEITVELGNQVPDEGSLRVRIRASRSATEENRVPSLQLEFGFQASNEGRAEVRVSEQDTLISATADAPAIYEWNIPLSEIYPRNAFRDTAKMGGLPSPSEFIRFVNSSVPQGNHGDIQIDYVQVQAPVYETWPPASHRQIFFESPNQADEATYAREILSAFMSKAWRRDITEKQLNQKLQLFSVMRKQCDSFEDAMVEVLATVLSAPQFLYVVREESPDTAELSDYELATRLSVFLWSSVPDEQLLQLAASGQLRNSAVLAEQVQRMLDDSRSNRFAKHFVHQWLDMQLLDFLAFQKGTDPLLKEAMLAQPVAFFSHILRRNESVLNFIHADDTVTNERLARHCGIPDVRGNHFRPVALPVGHQRGGLLTLPGLLAMNSNGTDSHPLKRGVWLLESVLNDPPPPPPPAVPEIDLADPEIAKLTLKQRIEDHRNHAACFSCHAKIDPWGIAFENYDALGRWRTQIDGQPVDATSLLFNQQKLDGMEGLKRFLLENRQDQIVRAIVYKLATYALGRPLTFSDYSEIDNVTAAVRQQSDGLATAIHQLIASDLFQSP